MDDLDLRLLPKLLELVVPTVRNLANSFSGNSSVLSLSSSRSLMSFLSLSSIPVVEDFSSYLSYSDFLLDLNGDEEDALRGLVLFVTREVSSRIPRESLLRLLLFDDDPKSPLLREEDMET